MTAPEPRGQEADGGDQRQDGHRQQSPGGIPERGQHEEDRETQRAEEQESQQQRRDQRGGTLSGGEQQMLAIARALMGRPKLLLLDEPSLGLAPLIVKQIFGAIKELNRQGLTVFLVEQNAYHTLKLCHRGYVMVNGRITQSGTGEELLQREEVQTAYLDGGGRKSLQQGGQ